MDDLRTPPPLPKTARYFNLAVAALVFFAMLAFAGWVMVTSLSQPHPELLRAAGGTILAIGAVLLLASLRSEWCSGEPFQHGRGFGMGMALFGIGGAVLVAGG